MPKNNKTAALDADRAVAELTESIIDAIQDVKGVHIVEIDLDSLESAPASKFVICQGKSTTQVSSIADNIEEKVRERCRIKPYSVDGTRNAQWIVMDYGSVMAHVFLPEARDLYNLEELWGDATIREIADLD